MELIKYFSNEQYQNALESWKWLPIAGKKPFLTNAFGSVFFISENGVEILDVLEGMLVEVCDTKEELQNVLNTGEGQEMYLWASLVVDLNKGGKVLDQNQVYDFEVNPVLGGDYAIENIECTDFVVVVNVAGQIHGQVKDMPPGTPISEIKIIDPNQSE